MAKDAVELAIDDKLVDTLNKIDEKIKHIGGYARTLGQNFRQAFGEQGNLHKVVSVVDLLRKMGDSLDRIEKNTSGLNGVGTALRNIESGAKGAESAAKRAGDAIARATEQAQQKPHVDTNYGQYQQIAGQIEQLTQRQAVLNGIVKEYERVMANINSGKGGVISAGATEQYKSAQTELQAIQQQVTELRAKQQAIVDGNKAYQQQVQLLESLRNFDKERNSLPNKRSEDVLAQMRSYYRQEEKESARAAKQKEAAKAKEMKDDERRYNAWLKQKDEELRVERRNTEEAEKQRQRGMAASKQQYLNTPQGALGFSGSAGTLAQHMQAIQYLRNACLQLNTTDKDYQSQLNQINSAIARHTNELKNAGVMSQKLAESHRQLWNISEQLTRQFALMFSVSQIEGYISKMAKVRGEMELQQRSLQAILQNKTKADEVFNKTVQSALKSPFRIQQLVTYTKQLAAYRVESDKLFDTTKRLADVSAGLGVDMQRLILAYGQVKAAAYLRGTEVRQFTEAGINLYGELQKYFEEVKGEAHTTAEIVDMISKRKVTFEDIEQVFKRLTDQGGLFYNMQEIQSETLQGKIGKLQDAIDMMYNSIGKANEGIIKDSVDGLIWLTKNWDMVAELGLAAAAAFWSFRTGIIATNASMVAFRKNVAAVLTTRGMFTKWFMDMLASLKKISFSWSSFCTMAASGLKAVGRVMATIAASAMSMVPGLLLFAVVDAIYKHIDAQRRLNEEIAKGNKYFNEHMTSLHKINIEYKKTGDIDNMRAAVRKLVDQIKGEGIEIDVSLDGMSVDELRNTYNKYHDEYETYLANKKVLDREYAVNMDDIEKAMKEYSEVGNELLLNKNVEAVDAVIAKLEDGYDKLGVYGKAAFNKIKAAQAEELTELEKQVKIMEILDDLLYLRQDVDGMQSYILGKMEYRKILDETGYDYFGKMRAELSEHEAEVRKSLSSTIETANRLKKTLKENGLKDGEIEMQIKAFLDKKYVDRELDDLGRDLMYREFEIPIKVNKDDTLKAIRTLDDDIQEYFDGKTYDVKLRPRIVGKDLVDTSEEIGKDIKNWERVIAQLKGGTYNGTQYKAAKGTIFYHYKLEDLDKEQREIAGLLDANKIAMNQQAAAVKLLADEKKKHPNTKLTVKDFIKEGYISLSKEQLLKIAEAGKKREQETREILGYTLDKSHEKKGKDPYQEQLEAQIKLIEDMVAKYNELRKVQSQDLAAENTVEAFREQIKDVKLSDTIIGLFKPTDDGEIKKVAADLVDKIRRGFTDNNFNFIRGMNVSKYLKEFRAAGEKMGKWNAEVEVACDKDSLEAAKKEVEAAFAGMELYNKFVEMGLPASEIKQLPFFKEMKTSWAEVYAEINKKYNPMNLSADDLKKTVGEDVFKAWEDAIKKAREGEKNEQRKRMEDIIKDYRKQLNELWKIDRWYHEERKKIYAKDDKGNDIFTDKQKREYERELERQSNNRINDLQFNKFKQSTAYIAIFQALDKVSGATLDRLQKRIDGLQDSMKNLDASKLREMIAWSLKISEQKAAIDPFGELRKANNEVKKLRKNGDTPESLNSEIIANDTRIDKLEHENMLIERILASRNNDIQLTKEETNELAKHPELTQLNNVQLKATHQANEHDIETLNQSNNLNEKKLSIYNRQQIARQAALNAVNKLAESEQRVYASAKKLMEVLGASDEAMIWSDMAQDLISCTFQIINMYINMKILEAQAIACKVAFNTMLGVIGYILIAIEAVASVLTAIFNSKDAKLKKQIEGIEKRLENSKEAADELKEALEQCWDIDVLSKYEKDSEKLAKQMIKDYEKIISLEKKRKDPDEGKIKDAQKNIKELQKFLDEGLEESVLNKVGGIGKKNYADIAQDFANAWVSAFAEGENAMDSFNDKFDEMLQTMVAKQAAMRLVGKLTEPLLNMIDKYLSKDSEGGMNLTSNELKSIGKQADFTFENMNDDLYKLMETLGYTGKSSKLSALTKSIEGISETTAEALEATLNSIRLFVSQQTTDVRAIRDMLSEQYLSTNSSSTPMMVELKAQSGYLRELRNIFDGMATFDASSGKGLRVYMA